MLLLWWRRHWRTTLCLFLTKFPHFWIQLIFYFHFPFLLSIFFLLRKNPEIDGGATGSLSFVCFLLWNSTYFQLFWLTSAWLYCIGGSQCPRGAQSCPWFSGSFEKKTGLDAGGDECRYTARGPNLYWSSLEPGDWAPWIVKTEPGIGNR